MRLRINAPGAVCPGQPTSLDSWSVAKNNAFPQFSLVRLLLRLKGSIEVKGDHSMSSISQDGPATSLAWLRVLVVEDSSLIARKIEQVLLQAGYEVVGPTPTLNGALSKLQGLNAAVLDIDLRGEDVYPLAERLQELGTPFMFLTGFHELAIPDRWRGIPLIEKPFEDRVLLEAVARLAGGSRPDLPPQTPGRSLGKSRTFSLIRESRNLRMEGRVLYEK
jgi:CheY-like chemotaxis protein